MKIYTFPAVCAVCGGEGLGDIKTSASVWIPDDTVIHSNPLVCASVLRRRREELDRREEQLKKLDKPA